MTLIDTNRSLLVFISTKVDTYRSLPLIVSIEYLGYGLEWGEVGYNNSLMFEVSLMLVGD